MMATRDICMSMVGGQTSEVDGDMTDWGYSISVSVLQRLPMPVFANQSG